MKIYTKTGDQGDTRLFGGKKVRKDHPRVEACGAADELNSVLGGIVSQLKNEEIRRKLEARQRELFILGADLATPAGTKIPKIIPRLEPKHIAQLEEEIDAMESTLSPLKFFILPGGTPAGAATHFARAVCRRAERALISLSRKEKIYSANLVYLNRLSDYLFVLARRLNDIENQQEKPWRP